MILKNLKTSILSLGLLAIPLACSRGFEDHYTPTKWLTVYVFAFLAALCLTLDHRRNPKQPPIASVPGQKSVSLLTKKLLLGLFLFYAIAMIINSAGNYENHILNGLSFLAIASLSYSCFKRLNPTLNSLQLSNRVATVFVLGYSTLQIVGLEPFQNLWHNNYPASFFGFQNMTAEFLGISLLFQFSFLVQVKNRKNNILLFGLFGLIGASAAILYLLQCRAVYMAVFFAFIPYSWINRSTLQKKVTLIFVTGVLGVIIYLFMVPSQGERHLSQLAAIKKGNIELRLIRWRNTLKLIQEHPWGIGPGRFEFGYLSYRSAWKADLESNEQNIVRSPHNEFLMMVAEFGIPFSIIFSIVLGLLGKQLILMRRSNHERTLLFSVVIFFAVDAFFAFPLENAYPFYVMALMTGLALRLLGGSKELAIRPKPGIKVQWAMMGLTFGLACLTSTFAASKYVQANEPINYKNISLACHFFPSNWRNCITKARWEISQKRIPEAERTLREVIEANPNNFLALRYLSFTFFDQAEPEKGCSTLAQYDHLFDKASSLHPGYLKLCQQNGEKHKKM